MRYINIKDNSKKRKATEDEIKLLNAKLSKESKRLSVCNSLGLSVTVTHSANYPGNTLR